MNEAAIKIALKLIKKWEGCELRSYPDPASPLSKALSKRNLLRLYINGQCEIPEDLLQLSGKPYTAMYGETLGIEPGMVFTQAEADDRLQKRVEEFTKEVLLASPKLSDQTPSRLAAVVSLVYNIGLAQYQTSTVKKRVSTEDWIGAAEALTWFNKAGGELNKGLVARRADEKAVFLG